jgi:hypothetical protein
VGQNERSERLEFKWEDNIYVISRLIFASETSSVFLKTGPLIRILFNESWLTNG